MAAWDQLDLVDHPDGALLPVLARPRASRDRVAGVHDGRLALQLKAPPVDGAANAAAERFLAKHLGVGRGDVTLVKGASSRRKLFRIAGLDAAAVRSRLG